MSQAFRGAFAFTLLNRTVDTFGAPPDEAPKVTKVRGEIGSKAIDVIEAASNLFLPESELQNLSDKEREARIENFKQANPPDVRMLKNETDLNVEGDPIYITIQKKNGYVKIPMGYAKTDKEKQVLQIGKLYFVVRYLKTEGIAKGMTLPAIVSQATKQEGGIENTGSFKLGFLKYTEKTTIPYQRIMDNLEILAADEVLEGKMLSPHITGPRMFYYICIGDDCTALEKADLPDERQAASNLYKSITSMKNDDATITDDDDDTR